MPRINPIWTEPARVQRVVAAVDCSPEVACEYLIAEEGSESDAIWSYAGDHAGTAGADAFHDGVPRSHNPHLPRAHRAMWACWDHAWSAAVRNAAEVRRCLGAQS